AFLGSKVRALPLRERLPIFPFALLSIEIRKDLGLSADAWFCSNTFSILVMIKSSPSQLRCKAAFGLIT
ncbi:MAG: hypothetical protein ACK59W_19615, partial [Pseudanabaena sp.]